MGKGEKSVVYGLKYPARALCAVPAETEKNQFLVGSLSLKHENEVHHLDFDEERQDIERTIYRHPAGEIWQLSSCPSRPDLFFSCYSNASEGGVETKGTLFKMGQDDSERVRTLSTVCTLPSHSEKLQGIFWEPEEKIGRVISLDESNVRIWSLDSSLSAKASDSLNVSMNDKKGQAKLRTMAWNPHSPFSIATANDCAVRGWDLRSLRQTFTIEQAHTLSVRDVDYNPNKPHQIASCGDDCAIRFWDVRNVDKPLKTLTRHSHWIWRVMYNRVHDQLVLSSSSDCQVKLENVVSISSLTSLASSHAGDPDEAPQDPAEKQKDGLVLTYDQHEDSVYSLSWSVGDPWIFASVSYDGRVVINSVPRE